MNELTTGVAAVQEPDGTWNKVLHTQCPFCSVQCKAQIRMEIERMNPLKNR